MPDPNLSGVVFGRAQIERVNEMGFPGPVPYDVTNHLCDDLRASKFGHAYVRTCARVHVFCTH